MNYKYAFALGIGILLGFQGQVKAASMFLGSASDFAILGNSAVVNIGSSIVTGDLGVSSGFSVTGFPPGIVTSPGAIYAGDAVAAQAQLDNQVTYNYLASLASTANLTGQDLGGQTIVPGVYSFSSSAQLTGMLTLDNLGDANALFVFQIGSTLTTSSNSAVLMSNGDNPNVFFQVGSSATLGTGTQFKGNILANTSITLNTGANIDCGRVLAQNGAVTLDNNNVSTACASSQQVPEPDSLLSTFIVGLGCLLFVVRKQRKIGCCLVKD